MRRVKHDDVRNAELTANLNKARRIGDIAEMWRCAAELMVMDRDRPAKRPQCFFDLSSPSTQA